MNFRPFTVARYGVYAAASVALISIWLGQQAGGSFDYLLMRSVPIFVIVAALGFGADAILSIPESPKPSPADHEPQSPPAETSPEGTEV